MTNEELKEIVEVLTEWVCVGAPGAHGFSALIGPAGSGKSDIVQEVKNGFSPAEDVFWVSTSMANMQETEALDNPFWWFWTYIFEEFIKQVPMEKLQSLAEAKGLAASEELVTLKALYDFYGSEAHFPELNEQSSKEDDIKLLFECYTKLKVQIIWELAGFERMAELFPKTGEERRRKAGGNIYNKLFVLSPKSMDSFHLNLLLISQLEVLKLEHSMAGGSSLASAVDEIDLHDM